MKWKIFLKQFFSLSSLFCFLYLQKNLLIFKSLLDNAVLLHMFWNDLLLDAYARLRETYSLLTICASIAKSHTSGIQIPNNAKVVRLILSLTKIVNHAWHVLQDSLSTPTTIDVSAQQLLLISLQANNV